MTNATRSEQPLLSNKRQHWSSDDNKLFSHSDVEEYLELQANYHYRMPQINKVNSLQGICLENISLNIDMWYKIHVEIFGDRKVDHLDAKGPFDSLREYIVEMVEVKLYVLKLTAIISVSSIKDSGENHWNPC